jgi:hypothetical protein
VEPGDGQAHRVGDGEETGADKRCRRDDAERRQRQDQPLLPGDVMEVDVQAAGEEQQAEHAVQQDTREIDVGDGKPHLGRHGGIETGHDNRADGDHDSDGGDADRVRQPHESMIQVAENGDQAHDHADDLEGVHMRGHSGWPRTHMRLPPTTSIVGAVDTDLEVNLDGKWQSSRPQQKGGSPIRAPNSNRC